ncbi:unnamed protein product [Phytophthora fragariaefolia]|uniref:Unnamed protein product n=1 Tax=Phytophthora fragariaefolia TaxID=1490495 RepID=A0A9W7CH54_9STRA|nr:unnamed protein product [Phytophthora fragariaefolia]
MRASASESYPSDSKHSAYQLGFDLAGNGVRIGELDVWDRSRLVEASNSRFDRMSDNTRRRGRQPGYQNYSIEEQILLCNVADKFKPLGRIMWEDAAAEYNDRRARNWVHRESLKRTFRSLYSKTFEEKAGAHTRNDSFDQGDDGGQLSRELDAATSTKKAGMPEGEVRDEVNYESSESLGEEGDDIACGKEDSQASIPPLEGDTAPSFGPPELGAVGVVMTSTGNFDSSLADEV